LAEECGRSAPSAHKALAELSRRGYLRRTRGNTVVRDPLVLRADLLAAWRGRVGIAREHVSFVSRGKMQEAKELVRRIERGGGRALLAGWSAVEGPDVPVGEPITLYIDDSSLSNVEHEGFVRLQQGAGDLVIWRPPEHGVWLYPRSVNGCLATNRAITYLDLALSTDARSRRAAELIWEGENESER
jgi:hypothetical protein